MVGLLLFCYVQLARGDCSTRDAIYLSQLEACQLAIQRPAPEDWRCYALQFVWSDALSCAIKISCACAFFLLLIFKDMYDYHSASDTAWILLPPCNHGETHLLRKGPLLLSSRQFGAVWLVQMGISIITAGASSSWISIADLSDANNPPFIPVAVLFQIVWLATLCAWSWIVNGWLLHQFCCCCTRVQWGSRELAIEDRPTTVAHSLYDFWGVSWVLAFITIGFVAAPAAVLAVVAWSSNDFLSATTALWAVYSGRAVLFTVTTFPAYMLSIVISKIFACRCMVIG